MIAPAVHEIWFPRYHDRQDRGSWIVLIHPGKVKEYNKIIFTKAKHLQGVELYMTGVRIRKYPMETNGTIPCFAVPFNDFDTSLQKPDDDICKVHNAIMLDNGHCPIHLMEQGF
jgi:hypothetical protein